MGKRGSGWMKDGAGNGIGEGSFLGGKRSCFYYCRLFWRIIHQLETYQLWSSEANGIFTVSSAYVCLKENTMTEGAGIYQLERLMEFSDTAEGDTVRVEGSTK